MPAKHPANEKQTRCAPGSNSTPAGTFAAALQEQALGMLNACFDAALITTAAGTIHLVNTACCDLLGYCEQELLGKPADIIWAASGTHADTTKKPLLSAPPKKMFLSRQVGKLHGKIRYRKTYFQKGGETKGRGAELLHEFIKQFSSTILLRGGTMPATSVRTINKEARDRDYIDHHKSLYEQANRLREARINVSKNEKTERCSPIT